jgi:hypothetical protein
MCNQIIFRYDTQLYDFKGWAQWCLDCDDLSLLHTKAIFNDLSIREKGSRFHYLLHCDLTRDATRNLFCNFISNAVQAVFGPIVSFQERPALRVHLSGCGSISSFHKDRDWGMDPRCKSVWVPFTDVAGTNSLYIESRENAGDYQPVKLNYGEALIFDSANLFHGSMENTSGKTRVSADIRILPR